MTGQVARGGVVGDGPGMWRVGPHIYWAASSDDDVAVLDLRKYRGAWFQLPAEAGAVWRMLVEGIDLDPEAVPSAAEIEEFVGQLVERGWLVPATAPTRTRARAWLPWRRSTRLGQQGAAS